MSYCKLPNSGAVKFISVGCKFENSIHKGLLVSFFNHVPQRGTHVLWYGTRIACDNRFTSGKGFNIYEAERFVVTKHKQSITIKDLFHQFFFYQFTRKMNVFFKPQLHNQTLVKRFINSFSNNCNMHSSILFKRHSECAEYTTHIFFPVIQRRNMNETNYRTMSVF